MISARLNYAGGRHFAFFLTWPYNTSCFYLIYFVNHFHQAPKAAYPGQHTRKNATPSPKP